MQSQSQQSEKSRPCVVMLLANSFEHDTRVYKEARSLIEWGCEVHIIAMTGKELPLEEDNDSIQVHRLGFRKGDILRLGVVVLVWWCKPIARLALGKQTANGQLTQELDLGSQPNNKDNKILVRFGQLLHTVMRRTTQPFWMLLRSCYRATLKRSATVRKFMEYLFALRWIVRRGLRTVVRRGLRTVVRRGVRKGINLGLYMLLPYRVIKRLAPSSLRLVAMNLQFARKALSLEPDIVQAHDLNMLLGGALVRRLSSVRLVYDSHELYLRRNIGNKSRARDNLIWAPIERAFIGKCDAVLSVADGICEHLAKQYKINKPHLIRNVQPYETPQPKTTILADELMIPKDKKIVIYAGAVTINRGLEVMIDSAEHLENSVYVIMGYARNEAYLHSLKARASEQDVLSTKVYFREAVPINEVTRYVASADLGIVPTQNVCLSYFFESSNKIFHCMMAGVPLVMSDHYEKRLLVEQYDIGVLFDETYPTKIAKAVNDALADKEHYLKMRQNCFNAAKKMNWENEQRKLRNIFGELLGDRAPSNHEIMIENSSIENQSETPATQLLTS